MKKLLGVLLWVVCSVSMAFGYTLEGKLTTSTTGLIDGALITLSGSSSGTMYTTTLGTYCFTGLSAGSYAITPTKSGYSFSPSSYSFNAITANANRWFVGTPVGGAIFYKVVNDIANGRAVEYIAGNIQVGFTTGSANILITSTGNIVGVRTIYGQDSDTYIDFATDNEINFYAAGSLTPLFNSTKLP